MTTPKEPTLAMRMAIHSDAQRPFRELAEEFRMLAAENEAAIEKNGVVSLGYRAIEFKSAQRTWEQAAQMLEEKLNG